MGNLEKQDTKQKIRYWSACLAACTLFIFLSVRFSSAYFSYAIWNFIIFIFLILKKYISRNNIQYHFLEKVFLPYEEYCFFMAY